jgi:large subunit ribosomal protein L7/L12
MPLRTSELISTFKDMTLIELHEFTLLFEDTFGVTAQAPALAVQQVQAPQEEAAEEQAEFAVVLESAGDKKIQVIKEVRVLTSLGLKDAKDLVDSAPVSVAKDLPKDKADAMKKVLEAAGATVTLK